MSVSVKIFLALHYNMFWIAFQYGTPPESSTNEINLQSVVSKLGQNPNIICMEDDDFSSDTEMVNF